LSRKLRTKEGEIFRELDRKIVEQELIRDEIKREMKLYLRHSSGAPAGMSGIDYEGVRVQGGSWQISIDEALQKIDALQKNLNIVLEELTRLKRTKIRLERIFKKSSDVEKRILYYREIKGYSQESTARKLDYSVRQIQRIEAKMRGR
jgi:hypothetical protein